MHLAASDAAYGVSPMTETRRLKTTLDLRKDRPELFMVGNYVKFSPEAASEWVRRKILTIHRLGVSFVVPSICIFFGSSKDSRVRRFPHRLGVLFSAY